MGAAVLIFATTIVRPKINTRTADLAELAFMVDLVADGYLHVRPLPDGVRWAGLFRFMFTTAIITGRIGDRSCIEDRWCYHTEAVALAALEAWNGEGEPEGWHRHPMSGRRRENGTAELEEVRW